MAITTRVTSLVARLREEVVFVMVTFPEARSVPAFAAPRVAEKTAVEEVWIGDEPAGRGKLFVHGSRTILDPAPRLRGQSAPASIGGGGGAAVPGGSPHCAQVW